MHRSILLDILPEAETIDGAAELLGSRADFGDPAGELEALSLGCALLDETDLGALRAAGPDATDFLQRVLAGDVRGLAAGEIRRNLLLSAKGKVRGLFELARLSSDELLLLCPPGGAASLRAALDAYLFAEELELLDTSAEHAPLALVGPLAEATFASAFPGLPPPPDGRVARCEQGSVALLVLHRRRHGAPGFLIDGGPAAAAELWRALRAAGARPCGRQAREVHRIAAGAALPGLDVDDSRYPQEARLEDAFSLAKGCYVGQEVVAKIDTYGGLHRRLVVLESESAQLAVGSALFELESGERREIGEVSSSAPRPQGGSLALAYVKLEHEGPGTRLAVGEEGSEARVIRPTTG